MELIDIASIVFVCVTANHLGLVKAIEGTIKKEIPIINCPKCASFWLVLAYFVIFSQNYIPALAISFLASYIAIWLELLEGFIDSIYLKVYEKIYSDTSDNAPATEPDDGNSASTMS